MDTAGPLRRLFSLLALLQLSELSTTTRHTTVHAINKRRTCASRLFVGHGHNLGCWTSSWSHAALLGHLYDRSVRGLIFSFVALDAAGDLASLLSVSKSLDSICSTGLKRHLLVEVLINPIDIEDSIIYALKLVLWLGIMVLGFAFNFRGWLKRRNPHSVTAAESHGWTNLSCAISTASPPLQKDTAWFSSISVFRRLVFEVEASAPLDPQGRHTFVHRLDMFVHFA